MPYADLREERFVEFDGEPFYGIPDVDRLPPFLMSILSGGDHWMFVSSRGGLTAGRRDANSALFPYETDDRLHVANGVTGPTTVVRGRRADTIWTWLPLHGRASPVVRRNIYKSVVGNQLVFEEVNERLGLVFRYRMTSSDRFGFIRTASLANAGNHVVGVDLVDGLLNLLPHGVDPATYRAMSNLTNAYRRSELIDAATKLAVFSLESLISDRAEPGEALTATVAWSTGLNDARVLLDPSAIEIFRAGRAPDSDRVVTGRPGAYLLESHQVVPAGDTVEWTIVTDVARRQRQVVELLRFLSSDDPQPAITESIHAGTESLAALLASADGMQHTGDRMAAAHHLANVAFNTMRGGLFNSATEIVRDEFATFLRRRNRPVAARHESAFDALPDRIDRAALLEYADVSTDPQLMRLAREYLPVTFSRRHGDPSRPWNAFSIRVRDDDGRPVVHYEGNWRDIFQNWEALCTSFPEYLPSVVAVFLNASTPDGFNPYRITSDGIDWEVPEPDNPWANIGYWGDHQIVYLDRLLMMMQRYKPTALDGMLGERRFAYADVPYRIDPYEAIIRDPRSTIEFDDAAAERSAARVTELGGDGKLVPSAAGDVYLVSMVEKLLVPTLAKLSNLVPDGGIWMNTQRPEWNDANNALVGNGLSMVTVCHLRSHLDHLAMLLERSGLDVADLSTEVAQWASRIAAVLEDNANYPGGKLDDVRRRRVVDSLGSAFSDYRADIYAVGFSGTTPVQLAELVTLFQSAVRHLDDTIRSNRRPDALYHAYNLINFDEGDASAAAVEHLQPMLEGQVAVLSCGLLSADEKVEVLDALFASAMYRPDQNSFMLYPARGLPSFLDKAVVPDSVVSGIPLLGELAANGDGSIIEVDGEGRYRFGPRCVNRPALMAELDRLAQDDRWRELVSRDADAVAGAYEDVFNHHAYTGRSGSMYGYEGIGSIYWHMVAKLLVAVQESILEAIDAGSDPETVGRLAAFYWRVRSGLGFEKTAGEFGAFPMDPYSHTPAHAGAQQPGMTGQVKEEILTRLLELGLRVRDGEIHVEPVLLRPETFVTAPTSWNVRTADGASEEIDLPADSLGLTLCHVPVVVTLGEGPGAIEVELADGTVRRFPGSVLDRSTSAEIFRRDGAVRRVNVFVAHEFGGDGA